MFNHYKKLGICIVSLVLTFFVFISFPVTANLKSGNYSSVLQLEKSKLSPPLITGNQASKGRKKSATGIRLQERGSGADTALTQEAWMAVIAGATGELEIAESFIDTDPLKAMVWAITALQHMERAYLGLQALGSDVTMPEAYSVRAYSIIERAQNFHIGKTITPSLVNVYGLIHGRISKKEDPFSSANMQRVIEKYPRFKAVLSRYIEAKLKLAGLEGKAYQEMSKNLSVLETMLRLEIENVSDGTERALLSNILATAGSLVSSNLFEPFYDPVDPPALLFDGVLLTENPRDQFVAYLPDRTASFSLIPLIDFKKEAYTAGGIRIKHPGAYNMDNIWKEVYDLADSMDFKDKWSGIVSAGSKWELALAEGYGDDTEVLKRMATSAVGLVNFGLFPYNIAGPDVNSGEKQIQPAVDALRQRYRQHIELEMKLIEAVLTGRINGNDIPEDGVTEIALEGGRIIKISNKALMRSHGIFWQTSPVGAKKGEYTIASLSAKGRDSEEKTIRLYDTSDPAFSEYIRVLSIIQNELGVFFLKDPYIYAMREQALNGLRKGVITDLTIPDETKIVFDKIIGVAIGGGAKAAGSLVAHEGLSDITARGTVRALVHVAHYLKDKGVITGEKPNVIIRGAGTVGEASAELLTELGFKVVGISDEEGAIYKESGFTDEDIRRLKEERLRAKEEKRKEYVVAALGEREGVVRYDNPDDILWKEADILLPAAIGPTVTKENVDKFIVKAIVPGENNAIADREVEKLLHQRGILAFEGSTVNYGTAYVVCAKEGEVKHRLSVAQILANIDALIQESRDEVISREDDLVPILLSLQDRDTTPNDVHREVVSEIRSLMEEVYFDKDGKYKDRIDTIIKRIRGSGSYMPYHAARSYAAMEIARGDVILGYQLAGLVQPRIKEGRARIFAQPKRAVLQTATELADLITRNNTLARDTNIASPTGGTPEEVYYELIRMHKEEGLDLSRVTMFAFDEYLGLPKEHPQRYSNYPPFKRLKEETNIRAIHVLNADAPDIQQELAGYEARIREAGGYDAIIMPMGPNGHYAFKEPAYIINDINQLRDLRGKEGELSILRDEFNQFEIDVAPENLDEAVGLIIELFGESGNMPAYIYIADKMNTRLDSFHRGQIDSIKQRLVQYNGRIRLYETSFFATGAQDVYLTPETRKANARYFNDISEVPEQAITTNPLLFIRDDTLVIGLVTGKTKETPFYKSIFDNVNPATPIGRIYQGVRGIHIYADLEAADTIRRQK
ncbi:MAG: 6-phosphogluconolactonase [Candidatus Omnitrophota bacterium]